MKGFVCLIAVAAVALGISFAPCLAAEDSSPGQQNSLEALIDVLAEKGILTSEESDDLKARAAEAEKPAPPPAPGTRSRGRSQGRASCGRDRASPRRRRGPRPDGGGGPPGRRRSGCGACRRSVAAGAPAHKRRRRLRHPPGAPLLHGRPQPRRRLQGPVPVRLGPHKPEPPRRPDGLARLGLRRPLRRPAPDPVRV